MASEFIEKSKHPELTKMAEDHIMGRPRGAADHDDTLPTPGTHPPFGGPGRDAPYTHGVNYVARQYAGDTRSYTEEFDK